MPRSAVLTLSFATLLPAGLAWAQASQPDLEARAAWLREHAVSIETIDPALEDDDFADLMPLVDLIGDVQVVGLGEQTHGDGAAFHAKIRLIKFLHEVMGYDVLVWESGMYSCRLVEEAIQGGEPATEAWKKGIFGVWGMSEQVQPLFEYVQATRATDRPLEIAGTDSQMTGQGAGEALKAQLIEVYEQSGSPAALADAFEVIGRNFDLAKFPPLPNHKDIDVAAMDEAAQVVIAELRSDDGAFAAVDARERAFLARSLVNFNAMVEMVYWMVKSRSDEAADDDMFKYASIREPHFADTLVYLAREHYPDRKLIVWAASSHLTYNSRKVEWPDGADGWKFDDSPWDPMGNRVHEALGADFYVIDCIAYEGEIGSVAGWSRPLEAAEPGSIDALCHESGHPYLYVDMRSLPDTEGGAWLRERLVARPRGYGSMRANWGEVCDAFLFTDVMFPSTAFKPAPEPEDESGED